MKPAPEKVRAIVESRAPKDKAELQSSLGLASYIRRFVPHYATIAAPLTALLKKNRPWTWSAEENEAFESLKHALADVVLLSAALPGARILLFTDASTRAVGAVLAQWLETDEIQLLELASKKFTEAEARWNTHEQEAFAAVGC